MPQHTPQQSVLHNIARGPALKRLAYLCPSLAASRSLADSGLRKHGRHGIVSSWRSVGSKWPGQLDIRLRAMSIPRLADRNCNSPQLLRQCTGDASVLRAHTEASRNDGQKKPDVRTSWHMRTARPSAFPTPPLPSSVPPEPAMRDYVYALGLPGSSHHKGFAAPSR